MLSLLSPLFPPHLSQSSLCTVFVALVLVAIVSRFTIQLTDEKAPADPSQIAGNPAVRSRRPLLLLVVSRPTW